MNDFHKKILEARIKESNREWFAKRVLLVVLLVIIVFFALLSSCSTSDEKRTKTDSQFGMLSNDAIGVSKYSVSGAGSDPSGYYKVVCTEGHGLLTINDKGYLLAADEYKGTEHGSQIYTQDTIVYLEQNDILNARNLHSSSFRLDFFFKGENQN